MKNLILTLIITLPLTLWGQGWEQTFGDSLSNQMGYSVKQTSDGGYIITGKNRKFSGDDDISLIKTDGSGNEQWFKTFGDSLTDQRGYSVKQTSDGGYIITGVDENNLGAFLMKTDSYGDMLWKQNYIGESFSVQQTTDGGYIITGTRSVPGASNTSNYVTLIKTDSNGNELWSKLFGDTLSNYYEGRSVQQTTDGGYIITGYKEMGMMMDQNVYLIKTDGNGNITSTFEIPLPNSNRKLEKTIDILGREIIPKSNIPFIEIYDDGSVEKKLIIE